MKEQVLRRAAKAQRTLFKQDRVASIYNSLSCSDSTLTPVEKADCWVEQAASHFMTTHPVDLQSSAFHYRALEDIQYLLDKAFEAMPGHGPALALRREIQEATDIAYARSVDLAWILRPDPAEEAIAAAGIFNQAAEPALFEGDIIDLDLDAAEEIPVAINYKMPPQARQEQTLEFNGGA